MWLTRDLEITSLWKKLTSFLSSSSGALIQTPRADQQWLKLWVIWSSYKKTEAAAAAIGSRSMLLRSPHALLTEAFSPDEMDVRHSKLISLIMLYPTMSRYNIVYENKGNSFCLNCFWSYGNGRHYIQLVELGHWAASNALLVTS